MKLSDFKKTYDRVISLGGTCQPAEQLRLHNLRMSSGPFDWFIFENTDELANVLASRFQNFMKFENLEITGFHDERCYRVLDRATNCISVHDFERGQSLKESYPMFAERMNRRIERFLSDVDTQENILFVRRYGSRDSLNHLAEVLNKLCKNKWTLLAILPTGSLELKELECDFEDQLCYCEIYDDNNSWVGHQAHWDQLLNGITIKRQYLNLTDDTVFINWHRPERDADGEIYRWSTASSSIDFNHSKTIKKFSFDCFTYSPQPNDVEIYLNNHLFKQVRVNNLVWV